MSTFAVGPSSASVPPSALAPQNDRTDSQLLSQKLTKLTDKLQIINATFRYEVDKLLKKNVHPEDLRTISLSLQAFQDKLDRTTRKIAKLEEKFREMTNPE